MTRSHGPALPDLFGLFRGTVPPPEFEIVPPAAVPEQYNGLLVHNHHMTVTVEAHYGSLVNVRVLDRRRLGDRYARKILLTLQSDARVVQFGIALLWLNHCSAPVRAAILEEKTPLGRILIEHNVLRQIEPTAFFRVTTDSLLGGWFGRAEPTVTYGRLGVIYCDHKPAIELLEILAPIGPAEVS